jgi:hypothetical protein
MFRKRGLSACVRSLFFCVFCAIVLTAGCGSSTPIAINPLNAAIGTGQTAPFRDWDLAVVIAID